MRRPRRGVDRGPTSIGCARPAWAAALRLALILTVAACGPGARGGGRADPTPAGLGLGELIAFPECSINPKARGLHADHDPLRFLDRATGILTTPFKYLGISGWTDLGVRAEVLGRAKHGSAWSTDGFTTVDIHTDRLEIAIGLSRCRYERPPGAPYEAEVRVEVKPWILFPTEIGVQEGDAVHFCGRLRIDHDRGGFYEIHPETPDDARGQCGRIAGPGAP